MNGLGVTIERPLAGMPSGRSHGQGACRPGDPGMVVP